MRFIVSVSNHFFLILLFHSQLSSINSSLLKRKKVKYYIERYIKLMQNALEIVENRKSIVMFSLSARCLLQLFFFLSFSLLFGETIK